MPINQPLTKKDQANLSKSRMGAIGASMTAEEIEAEVARIHATNAGIVDYYRQQGLDPGSFVTFCEHLTAIYTFFENVYSEADPFTQVYKTCLKRLRQYHEYSINAYKMGDSFPIWSAIRSAIETITVLCEITTKPDGAKKWSGYDASGVAEKITTPSVAELLRDCRKRKYTPHTEGTFVFSNERHMDIFTKETMADIQGMDHFSFKAISEVISPGIDESGPSLIEVDGNVPEWKLFTYIQLIYRVAIEGFNHLHLAATRKEMGLQPDIMKYINNCHISFDGVLRYRKYLVERAEQRKQERLAATSVIQN